MRVGVAVEKAAVSIAMCGFLAAVNVGSSEYLRRDRTHSVYSRL